MLLQILVLGELNWIGFFIGIAILVLFGAVSKSMEKTKAKEAAEEEMKLRKERAEKAREAILASGNQEMINKLHLMEASHQQGTVNSGSNSQTGPGTSALGTAAAVAGGVLVADAISTSLHQADLEAALADVQSNFDAEVGELEAGFDGADLDGDGDGDFDLEI